jgi:hypothetical protein
MFRLLATAFVCLGMACGPAAAATADANSTLRETQGHVSVNQGSGFAPANLDMRLKPGDKISVSGKSAATIIFDDQCRLDIEANKSITVPELSACACRLASDSKKDETPTPNSTLRQMQGLVSVNDGKEFSPAKPDMRLKPGDRVMVQAQSHATIVFDDKCQLDIDANKLVTVPDQSVCACGLLVEQGLNPVGGSAIGGTAISNSTGAIIAGTITVITLCMDDVFAGEKLCGEDQEQDTVSP